jgi:hypothetical protein
MDGRIKSGHDEKGQCAFRKITVKRALSGGSRFSAISATVRKDVFAKH